MKSLQPRVSNSWQATARLLLAPTTAIPASRLVNPTRKLHPLQRQADNKAAYTTQTSKGYNFFINTTIHQTSSGRDIARERSFLHHYPRSIGLRHTKNLDYAPTTRVSYASKANMFSEYIIHDVFEIETSTWQYIIADPSTLTAIIIDPVLDYDRATQVVTTQAADSLLLIVKENGYTVDMILETHAHADHLTAASYLQHRLYQAQGYRPAIGIGKRIGQVQKLFGERYGISAEEYEGVFDKLFEDDETFNIGKLSGTALHLPGHTPDHLGYKIGDNVFCGDSVFHADIGTARCDFPGGSAKDLFNSGRKLLSLSDGVKIWPGHDYPPEGRDAVQPWMTVQHHKERNKHLMDGTTEKEFVALREKRDMTLAAPKLVHQSLQFNIRAGRLPKPMESGFRMLHLPLKLNCVEW